MKRQFKDSHARSKESITTKPSASASHCSSPFTFSRAFSLIKTSIVATYSIVPAAKPEKQKYKSKIFVSMINNNDSIVFPHAVTLQSRHCGVVLLSSVLALLFLVQRKQDPDADAEGGHDGEDEHVQHVEDEAGVDHPELQAHAERQHELVNCHG